MTGATGLIGSAVVAAAMARGYEAVVLTRDPNRAREHVPDATRYVAVQQQDQEAGCLASVLAGVDHLVNLAGPPLFSSFHRTQGIFTGRLSSESWGPNSWSRRCWRPRARAVP